MNVSDNVVVLIKAAGMLSNIVSFPLNCYVIWLILVGTKKSWETDIFSFNLALSEIFMCSSSLWFLLYADTNLPIFLQAFFFSNGLVFTARPLFQCCICVECYVGVVHPVFFLKCKPLRYRMAFCCIPWMIILTSCFYSVYTFFEPLHHFIFFVGNLLFMSGILFCCLSVLKALKCPGPGENDKEKRTSNKMKRRAFKITFLIMISTVTNVCLYVGAIPLQFYLKNANYFDVLTICLCSTVVTGFIQPILYLHRSGKLTCFRNI